MEKQDAEEFTQSLGQIVGGSWRQIALAKRLGVPKALGLSVDAWVNDRLGGYIKLSIEDRRKAVEELAAEGNSNRAIASVVGVDEGTIRNDLAENSAPESNSKSDGSGQIAENSAPLDAIAALAIHEEIRRPARDLTPHVANNSGDNEWYTPAHLIEAARDVMGSIDVDPASSVIANRTVAAERFYTKEMNGLLFDWIGMVWMNPPYAQPLVDEFCTKMVSEIENGNVVQACSLVNNATETRWFQALMSKASAVCFLRSRVKFLDEEGSPSGAPLQGQAVIYAGNDAEKFAVRFGDLGTVLFAHP